MSEDIEKKLLEEDAERLEADRQKWIVNRKRQRNHFQLLSKRMVVLNKDPNVDTAEEIWNNDIEPKIDSKE